MSENEILRAALGLAADESPFPWQSRLLRRFEAGDIPRSLDVPTGLGKTATIAIWLIARARGAVVPRRLIYVVDRRAVVDQATEVAMTLREWVANEPSIRAGLGLQDRHLPISTLRGQFVDNREWLEDPAGPAIVVGTVDMVGSRLLFEGYGTSRKMRPYHAGLIGNDALIVLDEAHLVPPFERLIERVALHGLDLGPVAEATLATPPPLRLLSLSATGRSQGGSPFHLDEDDFGDGDANIPGHPIVRQRLGAPKRLTVEACTSKDLPATLAERAWQLSGQGADPIGCIVFTTRRQDAESALAELRKLAGLHKMKKGAVPAADVELLVGGRRLFERENGVEQLRNLGFLAGSESRVRPAFLFATSAGEVGVDLDADHMVCDLVPWERMIQRLGRVNRRGRGDANVSVFAASDTGDEDQHAAIHALIERLPLLTDDARDASPGALQRLQQSAHDDDEARALLERASTPDPLYPLLDRPTLDAWSMTSLRDHPGRPAVAPWLRGWIEERPQTTIVWRKHLPVPKPVASQTESRRAAKQRDIEEFFEAARPHATEKLETDSDRVAEWLEKRTKHVQQGRPRHGLVEDDIVAITVGRDSETRTWSLRQLTATTKKRLERELAGATLLVDVRLAGLSDGLLDHSNDDPPPSLDGGAWVDDAPDAPDGPPVVRFRVLLSTSVDRFTDRQWRERYRLARAWDPDGTPTEWLVVHKWRHDAATEDDRSAGHPQLLTEHHNWTEERARRIAEQLGLSKEATHVLATAARLHDEGKRAPQWQAAFNAAKDGIYAKTLGPLYPHLLHGYRHEFGSLPYVARDPDVSAMPPDQRDLVMHLVASHHGFARPVISAEGDRDAPPSALSERAREVALRFTRLQQTWGPWGLAWWESLLRAADHQASRDNDSRTETT